VEKNSCRVTKSCIVWKKCWRSDKNFVACKYSFSRTDLKLGDLDADVEELAVSLQVGVVAARDLVLAAETRVRNCVWNRFEESVSPVNLIFGKNWIMVNYVQVYAYVLLQCLWI
jgi:hypothetical protein